MCNRPTRDMLIRPAERSDVAAIAAIYADAVRSGTATFEIEPPDEAEMAHRREALVAKDFPYLVAQCDGAVAGYAYASPYHPRAAYRWTAEDTVYVSPAFHRRGLGRLLMTALIADVQARGFRQLIGIVGDSTNTASIGLHASVGFRHVGTVQSVGFKHGRWLDIVVMQRPLGSGDTTLP
jgi:L-amino acid N-acyltransferase YncA